MGLANGIFIVDTHMHIQRHAVGFKKSGENPDYKLLHEGMHTITAYDNSPRGLYHMDRYGVNVSVLQTAYGMSDELDVEIMKKHPDRFVCICKDANTQHRAMRGEKEWTIEDAAKEIDEKLATGNYVGIGEGLPRNRDPKRKRISWGERFDQICQIMELARKYKVPVQIHTGFPSGYGGSLDLAMVQGHYDHECANPLLCHEIAAA